MINRTVLVGRLTRDPELRKTNTGKSVVSFTVACNRRFGQQDQQADFINCVAWERQAEFLANYLPKGSLVGIEGRIQSRSYEDATGKRVYVQEVVVESIQGLESRSQRESNNDNASTYTQTYESESNNDYASDEEPILDITSDDLPF